MSDSETALLHDTPPKTGREMTTVTPTDRPKSVRNRCVIKVLVVSLRCLLVFEFSVGIGFFCHRTESDFLLFLFRIEQKITALLSTCL